MAAGNEPIDLYAIAIKQAADAVTAATWACTLANCSELRKAIRDVRTLTELMGELAACSGPQMSPLSRIDPMW